MSNLQQVKDRAQKAEDEMDRLTAGNPSTNWRWSIPANPDRDSDLILSASAADARKLVASLDSYAERLNEYGRRDFYAHIEEALA